MIRRQSYRGVAQVGLAIAARFDDKRDFRIHSLHGTLRPPMSISLMWRTKNVTKIYSVTVNYRGSGPMTSRLKGVLKQVSMCNWYISPRYCPWIQPFLQTNFPLLPKPTSAVPLIDRLGIETNRIGTKSQYKKNNKGETSVIAFDDIATLLFDMYCW